MSAATVIALIFNFGFGITILIYYFMNFKAANSYMKYGAVTAVAYIVLFALSSISLQASTHSNFVSGFVLFLTLISALKLAVSTSAGFLLSSDGRIPDMPLVRGLYKEEGLEEVDGRKYILYTSLVILGSVIYTFVLFKLTSPEASDFLKNLSGNNQIASKFASTITISTIFSVISPVISEEVIFRLIFPNFLYKIFHLNENKYWIVIIISAAFWAVCHSNTLNPEWVKLVQIFPIGIALGCLYKKFGLESSIIAHSIFNTIMVLLNGILMS